VRIAQSQAEPHGVANPVGVDFESEGGTWQRR
jgi:hypothetical protein